MSQPHPVAGMRFKQNGPYIPGELLLARDHGQVVFVCGAGVAQEDADGPSFIHLARKVCTQLGVPATHTAQKLCTTADASQSLHNVSMDYVFKLLERDYYKKDIERVVASCLKPTKPVSLDAHTCLIRLATTPDERIQLVTTNFDRFFSLAAPDAKIILPPNLPNPLNSEGLDGIIYIHGRATPDYGGAEGQGLIISTSGFGLAYLADGWATEFYKKLISTYSVVFIGYSADDPPVSYLLEALNSMDHAKQPLYAFVPDSAPEARARWIDKNVQVISYTSNKKDDHKALWETLQAWAIRADGINKWYSDTLLLAQQSPESLEPYQRGQIAHVVTTHAGAKKFAAMVPPPAAGWLCVFDHYCRNEQYASPDATVEAGQQPNVFTLDPDFDFQMNTLDNPRVSPPIPWDAFEINTYDIAELGMRGYIPLRFKASEDIPELPDRIQQLCRWLGGITSHPITIWWAAQQKTIHPDFLQNLEHALRSAKHLYLQRQNPEVEKAWAYIFSSWRTCQSSLFAFYRHAQMSTMDSQFDMLKTSLVNKPLDKMRLRQLMAALRPYIYIDIDDKPPRPVKNTVSSLSEVVHAKVYYPVLARGLNPFSQLAIPTKLLAFCVTLFRDNLKYGLEMEKELQESYGTNVLQAAAKPFSAAAQTGLYVLKALFIQLREYSPAVARIESTFWPQDEPFFVKLKKWAASLESTSPANDTQLNNNHLLTDLHSSTADLEKPPHSTRPATASLRTQAQQEETSVQQQSVLASLIDILQNDLHLFQSEEQFLQLMNLHPTQTLTALESLAEKNTEFPLRAWTLFLESATRLSDSPRMLEQIAQICLDTPGEQWLQLFSVFSQWFSTSACRLLQHKPTLYKKVVDKLINSINLQPIVVDYYPSQPDAPLLKRFNTTPKKKIIQGFVDILTQPCSEYQKGTVLRHITQLLANKEGEAETLFHLSCYLPNLHTRVPQLFNKHIIPQFKVDTQFHEYCWAGLFTNSDIDLSLLTEQLVPDFIAYCSRLNFSSPFSLNMAALLLDYWVSQIASLGKTFANISLRNILQNTSEELRCALLSILQQKIQSGDFPVFTAELLNLLTEVWPREITANSPKVVSNLCLLIMSDRNRFPQLFSQVENLLMPIPAVDLQPLITNGIAQTYPQETLSFLMKITPYKAENWEYDNILKIISGVDPSLSGNSLFRELARRRY